MRARPPKRIRVVDDSGRPAVKLIETGGPVGRCAAHPGQGRPHKSASCPRRCRPVMMLFGGAPSDLLPVLIIKYVTNPQLLGVLKRTVRGAVMSILGL